MNQRSVPSAAKVRIPRKARPPAKLLGAMTGKASAAKPANGDEPGFFARVSYHAEKIVILHLLADFDTRNLRNRIPKSS